MSPPLTFFSVKNPFSLLYHQIPVRKFTFPRGNSSLHFFLLDHYNTTLFRMHACDDISRPSHSLVTQYIIFVIHTLCDVRS
jgi:hypothetical protein